MHKLIALLALAQVNANDGAEFKYNQGGADWGLIYPEC
jgi:hypothetical protein